MVLREASRALQAWSEMREEARRRQRFMRRWKNAGVGRAFESWDEMRRQGVQRRKLAKKVAGRRASTPSLLTPIPRFHTLTASLLAPIQPFHTPSATLGR